MTDLFDLAKRYEDHGVRIAQEAFVLGEVNVHKVAACANCFAIAKALRSQGGG